MVASLRCVVKELSKLQSLDNVSEHTARTFHT